MPTPVPIRELDRAVMRATYDEIVDYEQGKRLIQLHASVQLDRTARNGQAVALWAIRGYVWVECDIPGNYRLHRTSVSVYDYFN